MWGRREGGVGPPGQTCGGCKSGCGHRTPLCDCEAPALRAPCMWHRLARCCPEPQGTNARLPTAAQHSSGSGNRWADAPDVLHRRKGGRGQRVREHFLSGEAAAGIAGLGAARAPTQLDGAGHSDLFQVNQPHAERAALAACQNSRVTNTSSPMESRWSALRVAPGGVRSHGGPSRVRMQWAGSTAPTKSSRPCSSRLGTQENGRRSRNGPFVQDNLTSSLKFMEGIALDHQCDGPNAWFSGRKAVATILRNTGTSGPPNLPAHLDVVVASRWQKA